MNIRKLILLNLAILIPQTIRFSQYKPEIAPNYGKVQSSEVGIRSHCKTRPWTFRFLSRDFLVLRRDPIF